MTGQMATRLILRTFKHKKRKVSISRLVSMVPNCTDVKNSHKICYYCVIEIQNWQKNTTNSHLIRGDWFRKLVSVYSSITDRGRKDCLQQSFEACIGVKLFVVSEIILVDYCNDVISHWCGIPIIHHHAVTSMWKSRRPLCYIKLV